MKKIIFILALVFVLNFVWEIGQAFLYAPHFAGIAGLVTAHLRASLGDMLMIFIILGLDALAGGKIYAGEKMSKAGLGLVVLAGLVLAVAVEKQALASGRWAYDPSMPVIPGLNVGLTPILQMMLIPPVAAAIWSWLKRGGVA